MNRRGRAEQPKVHPKPKGFNATGPNQLWSWDITYLASAPVTRRDAAYDVQAWAVCREEMETFTRFRLPGEGGNRNQIQRWCRGDNRQSGRRLIQPQTPDLTITPDMANMWKLSFH